MKIADFVKTLARITRQNDIVWTLPDGAITSDDDCCPIHEVFQRTCDDDAYEECEDVFARGEWLELKPKQIASIMRAADKPGKSRLRKQLLEACGLTPQS